VTYHELQFGKVAFAVPRQSCLAVRLVKGKIFMKLDFRQRLLTTTLLVGASMIASPAFAQDTQTTKPQCPPGAPPADANCTTQDTATSNQPETTTPVEGQTTVPSTNANGGNVQSAGDIIITGTRIPQPNLTSASPVTVLSSQEVKLQGTTRTEDLINSLPQAFAAQGSNVSNGSTGTASLNLRGLGSKRTMVLVNGRRLQPGDPRSPTSDVNFIPAALIKRVDVLTGGASSVYGADAVAGVVNFIMDTNFRGLRVDAQASGFWHSQHGNDVVLDANARRGFRPPTGDSFNGGAQDIAVAFGAGFDDNRGSITAYATYRKQDAVLEATRDFSFCSITAQAAGGVNCGGSGTSANGTFFTNIGTLQIGNTNQFVAGSTPFNFAPYNYFQRPDERYTFGTFAEYEISPGAKPYLEAMFMDDHSDAQIAPSGDFGNTSTLNCDNPLLSAQQKTGVTTTTVGGVVIPVGICSAAIYNPADATVTNGKFDSFFGNLVGQTPNFGPDPDLVVDADGNVISNGPLQAPLLGFSAPTTFSGPTGNYTKAIAYTLRRNIEGGGRDDDLEHTSWRIVAGMKGDLLPGLSYDTYYQFGTTRLSQIYHNDFSVTRLGRALDVVNSVDSDGDGVVDSVPVCRSVLDGTDTNCVPYNIFSAGGVTQGALDYLQTPGFSHGNVNQTIAHADITVEGGEYGIQTPWSDRGVGLNFGGDYIKNSLKFDTDVEFTTGDLAGQGGPTIGVTGKYDVREAFAEIQIPIVSHSFFEELTLGAGYRYSDYKVANHHFNTDTYKLSLEFAPIHDIRARGSYNRAVRAPNIVELFSAQSVGLAGTTDPCAGDLSNTDPTDDPTASLEACRLTGVADAQYGTIAGNPAGQYNSFLGGNPNLAPETADSYTAGVVLQPRWVPGLALTVDYFDIKVKKVIGTIGYNTIMTQCLATGDPFFCSRIHRAPGNGNLWLPVSDLATGGYIVDLNDNVGGLRTKGIDVNGSYSHRLGGMGTLSLSMVGTYLMDLTTSPLAGISYDCKGFYGLQCGTPNPKWRHKARIGFTMPNGLGLSLQWRHFSSVKDDTLSSDLDLCPTNAAGTQCDPTSGVIARPFDRKLNSRDYFDLALSARIADRYNLRLGVNNILDKDPPLATNTAAGAYGARTSPPFGNGNTFPQVYDSLGRYLFAGVTIDF
jgi:iron complex outermembrane receptor protein